MFWRIPPELSPPTDAVPLPVTSRRPLDPVELSTIPFVGPLAAVPAEMLLNVSPLAPIVVLVTLRAVPVVVASVLVAPVTVTVPPPVAAKAAFAPVDNVSVFEKDIVEPVLLVNETPAPEVTLSVPPYVTVVPMTLLATENAVPAPLAFVIELPAGARNWPPTPERLTPPAAVVLSRSA